MASSAPQILALLSQRCCSYSVMSQGRQLSPHFGFTVSSLPVASPLSSSLLPLVPLISVASGGLCRSYATQHRNVLHRDGNVDAVGESKARVRNKKASRKHDHKGFSTEILTETSNEDPVSEVPHKREPSLCDDVNDKVKPGENKTRTRSSEESVKESRRKAAHSHIYYNIYPWTTAAELAQHLLQTKIFENSDFLVVNKPYGVAQESVLKVFGQRCYGRPPPHLSLQDTLPTLREMTDHGRLEVVMAPEKWNSGVAVLSKSPQARHAAEVAKFRTRGRLEGLGGPRGFWALTRYAPRPLHCLNPRRAACKMEPSSDGVKVPVIVFGPSARQIKNRVLHFFAGHHTTLAEGEEGTALVQVNTSSCKRNSVRVWLSHHLAPPVGDHLFGGRVASLMGHPVPVPHTRASSKQPYSYEFLQRLGLTPSYADLLPLFMHLRTVTLGDYYPATPEGDSIREHDRGCYSTPASAPPPFLCTRSATPPLSCTGDNVRGGKSMVKMDLETGEQVVKNKVPDRGSVGEQTLESRDLVFTAPLPEHFRWTLERLGISMER